MVIGQAACGAIARVWSSTVGVTRFGWQKRARIPFNTGCGEPGSSARPLQQLAPVLAELAGWADMPVEGLPGDAELAT